MKSRATIKETIYFPPLPLGKRSSRRAPISSFRTNQQRRKNPWESNRLLSPECIKNIRPAFAPQNWTFDVGHLRRKMFSSLFARRKWGASSSPSFFSRETMRHTTRPTWGEERDSSRLPSFSSSSSSCLPHKTLKRKINSVFFFLLPKRTGKQWAPEKKEK